MQVGEINCSSKKTWHCQKWKKKKKKKNQLLTLDGEGASHKTDVDHQICTEKSII